MRVEVGCEPDEAAATVQSTEYADGISGPGCEPTDLQLGDLQRRLHEGFGGPGRRDLASFGVAPACLQADITPGIHCSALVRESQRYPILIHVRIPDGFLPRALSLRQGIARRLEGRKLSLVGHVLDHADDEVGVRKTNGTTRRYTEAEMLAFKRPVMEAWERLLEPAAAATVLLPREELKAELVRRRAEQRGVNRDAKRARSKVVNRKPQDGKNKQRAGAAGAPG